MADSTNGADLDHPILNLTPDEKRVFSYWFQQADTEKLGVITGEAAVKFFDKSGLQPRLLGEIWQIADTENRGLLTSAGFCQLLRLIGHHQAGRELSPELAFRPAPLPKFDGIPLPPAPAPAPSYGAPAPGLQPQVSGGPIRVPPLTPVKAAEFASLFEKSGAHNGILSGDNAKQIFEKAGLPTDVLGRIWNLADTENRGAFGVTEFIIAMHLLASYRTGTLKALPNTLPAGLYEAAARRGVLPPPPGRPRPDEPISAVPRQFSGAGPQRNPSPMNKVPFVAPTQSAQSTGNDWLISPADKASFDSLFDKVDTFGRGYITGEQAVQFFSDSGLPEDVLAGIWDLADINSEGQLNRDEFAVAMYLIRQQRKPGNLLPPALPLNLVPPSMRKQARPAPPPQVAQTVDRPAPYISQAPTSAAEDLFGLDTFSAPAPAPPQTHQSTGGSVPLNRAFDNDPFSSKATSPTSPQAFQPAPRNPASTFKPFMPTSSFGQTLTSHSTGASAGSSGPQGRGHHASAMDDLLGDHDPETNKKLTQETAELANMSNQIGTLRTQMQEVQNRKTTTESDLTSASTQRRDLELRLAQFKTQYEQEVKIVKDLEERLLASRNETRNLQQELARIDGTYQDLQGQHRQVASALEADQRENAHLKERIRQVNAEISQLRPQLERMRSDARQQKGLVAINKKQLATNEGERDKIKSEMGELQKAAQESFRSPAPEQTSAVTSPAPSVASNSMNPFFRKSPQPVGENAMSPSGFSREGSSSHQKDFDNVFGPAFPAVATSAPPPTSFRSESQPQAPMFSAPSGPSVRSSEPGVLTPATSPPLSAYHESPRTGEPPPPPESRQFASSFLPLRDANPRSESFTSSVKVSAPASRYGPPETETSTLSQGSPAATPVPEKPAVERPDAPRPDADTFGSNIFDRNLSASPVASMKSDDVRSSSKAEERKDTFPGFAPTPSNHDIPGAFPRETSSPLQQMRTGETNLSDRSKGATRSPEGAGSRSDPFSAVREQSRGATSAKVDFDAAFAGFSTGRQFSDAGSATNGSVGAASKFNQEFPPIEDLAHDDDTDSASEQGFADNFTSASPQRHRDSVGKPQQPLRQPTAGEGSADEFFKSRPTPSHADSTAPSLPSPGAQRPPPTYEQTVGSTSRAGPRDANQFPPEFSGLLPSRQDPTSSQAGATASEKPFGGSSQEGPGGALFGGPLPQPGPSGPPNAFTSSPPQTAASPSTAPAESYHAVPFPGPENNKGPSPTANIPSAANPSFADDFDAGFDDLAEAKEADDKIDDEFMVNSQQREGFDEFNPVFDSPTASKSNTMASQQTPIGRSGHLNDSFGDFEHITQSFGQSEGQQPPATTDSQDWDAIFSNMEPSKSDKRARETSGDLGKSVFEELDAEPVSGAPSKQAQLPQLARALSAGTEHDDPILKKLTGMGYPRGDALAALEKFDYDINKAADYLTSTQ